jgi:catechol 2,3-dioxygenase-like lactoylglutathione lyase family enzyme
MVSHSAALTPAQQGRTLGGARKGVAVIDHLVLDVRDLQASRRFYEQALRPLGYQVVSESESFCGLGTNGQTRLGLRRRGPSGPVHFAVTSPDRRTVDAFHEAAIAASGQDNGPPGVRHTTRITSPPSS